MKAYAGAWDGRSLAPEPSPGVALYRYGQLGEPSVDCCRTVPSLVQQ